MGIDTGIALVIATFVGPIAAVIITLWHQARKQRRDAKERLFITVMAHRQSAPPSPEWVDALNLIDVIYSDEPKVKTAWHNLYDYTHTRPIDSRILRARTLD